MVLLIVLNRLAVSLIKLLYRVDYYLLCVTRAEHVGGVILFCAAQNSILLSRQAAAVFRSMLDTDKRDEVPHGVACCGLHCWLCL